MRHIRTGKNIGHKVMNLYTLSSEYQRLLDKEEYTDQEMAELMALHENVQDAAVDRAKYIKNLEAEMEAVNQEIAIMKARADDLKNKAQRQRERLISFMQENKQTDIHHPLMRIVIPKPRASVDIQDESLIPEKYITEETKTIEKISKVAIKNELEAGREVPGAVLKYNTKVDFK